MNENLVTHDSIEDLVKSIPQKNRDVIRKLVEDLFISEAFMEPIKEYENASKNYDEFKRKWDLENKKRIINYDELKKEKDPDLESSYRLLQERKTKLKKMFSQDEVDAIPAPTEEL